MLEDLAELRRRDNHRRLILSPGLDFSSNDYLGLSGHPTVRRALIRELEAGVALGSGGSRLLRGNHGWHERIEARLAAFRGVPAALAFNSGFDANVGVLSTLCPPGGLVLSDEKNHASIIDGVRASRAEYRVFPHNDLDAVDRLLRGHAGTLPPTIVTESVFSMEGDRAPLAELLALARRHGAGLIVDEAHATGVFGPTGAGLLDGLETGDVPLVSIHTCGKALGGCGAFVACSQAVKEYLVNHCRTFIFTTALPPLAMVHWEAALDLIASEPWRRRHVLALAERLRTGLRGVADCGASTTQIVPVLLGSNARALAAAAGLQERGFDIRPIRYPTVPQGTARLRIALNATHDEATIERLIAALRELIAATAAA
ncbi:MAG: 8-amino-7-oxononanoate synthase [Candidatus Lambdaproteobacteria bacterium]|nr:8-amino-7-oxononanoate synthase [Candidatus Lambdaproteobacteria bacterium]